MAVRDIHSEQCLRQVNKGEAIDIHIDTVRTNHSARFTYKGLLFVHRHNVFIVVQFCEIHE